MTESWKPNKSEYKRTITSLEQYIIVEKQRDLLVEFVAKSKVSQHKKMKINDSIFIMNDYLRQLHPKVIFQVKYIDTGIIKDLKLPYDVHV